jgi:hypothetical protein
VIAVVIGAGGAEQLAADKRDTAGIVHAVAVANVMWCMQRCEVVAAVEVVTTGIEDELEVATIVSHA